MWNFCSGGLASLKLFPPGGLPGNPPACLSQQPTLKSCRHCFKHVLQCWGCVRCFRGWVRGFVWGVRGGSGCYTTLNPNSTLNPKPQTLRDLRALTLSPRPLLKSMGPQSLDHRPPPPPGCGSHCRQLGKPTIPFGEGS